ncbi:MAG: DUF5320 domain-containing protein [Thaumarchaeota archaeon]|nr:DUF5320 domain-containing protein [Nitrososphaerota archaeon]
MCDCCHYEYCCLHGRRRYHPRYTYEPAPIYYEPPRVEVRREYLEEEKRALERRLKEIEDRLSEEKKSE